MSNTETTALIQQLQQSNRRWKRLAISQLVVLGLALLLGTASFGSLRSRSEQQAREAQAAAEEVRQRAQEAEELARQQDEEGRKRLMDKIDALDSLLKKDGKPK